MIEKKIPHELYNPKSRNQYYDIALLRLEKRVDYNDFVMPICLPRPQILRNKIFDDEKLQVTGWGRTETANFSPIKLKVTVDGVSISTCNKVYALEQIKLSQTGQICAGGKKDQDSCQGDSGGPLMAFDPLYGYYLVGIVSFGPSPCALEGWPGVYTKVGNFIDWIESKLVS